MRIVTIVWTAVWTLASAGSVLAQDFDSVRLTTVPVTGRVSVVAGGGGNIGVLVGDDGALLIDTAYGELEQKVRAALASVGAEPVRLVVNTHWHFDHVGCNACFGRNGAAIVGPVGSRGWMASEQEFPLLGARSAALPAPALPLVEVGEEAVLHFGGEEIRLTRFAGAHSGSDLAVLFTGANVLHAGDLFWSEGYPYIGTPHGGSLDGLIEAADGLLAMADDRTVVIPGHGRLSDREGLGRYRDLLMAVRDRVTALVAAGQTVEEIVAAAPTAEWDQERHVGMPPDVFVRLVHRDLTDSRQGSAIE